METTNRVSPRVRQRVAQACAMTLVVISAMFVAAELGWHPPLPSAWSLVAIAVAVRMGGLRGGVAAAFMAVAYAIHTEGFTTGHPPDVGLWGRPNQRILAFILAVGTVIGLVHHWLGARGPRIFGSNIWDMSPEGGSSAWLIAELDVDGTIRRVNASGAQLLGHAPCELHGRSFMAMTYFPDREQLGIALARLRRGRRTEPVSVRLITASGAERSLVGRAFRVSEAGHVVVTAAIPEHSIPPHPPRHIVVASSASQPTVAH
jgi:PAS domain S-box-containing protein